MALIFERIQTDGIAELTYLATAVYCDGGYRASIAASILPQAGFGCGCNIPGSWQAWERAGFPVEGDHKKETP